MNGKKFFLQDFPQPFWWALPLRQLSLPKAMRQGVVTAVAGMDRAFRRKSSMCAC